MRPRDEHSLLSECRYHEPQPSAASGYDGTWEAKGGRWERVACRPATRIDCCKDVPPWRCSGCGETTEHEQSCHGGPGPVVPSAEPCPGCDRPVAWDAGSYKLGEHCRSNGHCTPPEGWPERVRRLRAELADMALAAERWRDAHHQLEAELAEARRKA